MLRHAIDWMVMMAVPRDERDAVLGDLAEEFEQRGRGSWRSLCGYAYQAMAVVGYGLAERFRPSLMSSATDEQPSQGFLRRTLGSMIGGAGPELRQVWRGLRRTPAFSLIAVLTLAIGIGGSVSIFSAVYPILFEPLPYPNANRVLSLADHSTSGGSLDVTYGTFQELLKRNQTLESLAVADGWRPALTQGESPERLEGQRVSVDFFRTLGVPPSVGRDFTDADYATGGPRLAILSDRLVRRRLGGDRSIVGRTVDFDGVPYEVVGIMPAGFENVLAPTVDVWAPLRYRATAPFQSAEWGHHLKMVARVRRDVNVDAASRDLAAIAAKPVPDLPRPAWASLAQGLIVIPLKDEVGRGVRSTLLAIAGAVGLILLMACVNVTNLLLGRSADRRGELAVRTALGAGPGRLVRQLLAESVVLALAGGALGLIIAEVGVRALVALAPSGLPRVDHIGVNGAVFAFALLLTTAVGIVVGLVPALGAARREIAGGLTDSSRRTTSGRQWLRRGLVVVEVTLALVLLVSAGLLWRSLTRLFSVPPGFESAHVLTMQVQEAGPRYNPDTARLQFFERALDAVRAVPGVTSAAFTSQLPLSGDTETYGVQIDHGGTSNGTEGDTAAFRYAVTPDYFATMRIPLIRGRLIEAGDRPGTPESIVVSESFAKSNFPNEDALGKRIRSGPEMGSDRPWDVIVGVVGNVKQQSLAITQPDAFYVANGQWPWVDSVQSLVVRTDLDPDALAPSIQRAVWSVDPHQPIVRVSTMAAMVDRSEAERHFALTIFQVFALVALTLAAIGMYGVLAAHVVERRREIGVRSALGAPRERILGMILGQGLGLTAVGVALGVAGAVLATRSIEALLFDTSRLDVPTYAVVVVTLAVVSVVACWVPAWRASRVDPLVALRAE